MKYYLVALFDDESYKKLNPIQRNLSKKYRANRNSPIPYIPIEVLENPNTDKLDLVIEKILKSYKIFKVELTNKAFISEANKTLNIKIEDIGYIKRLNRLLSDTLKLHSFNTKNYNDADLNMHISLANLNYVPKDLKKSEDDDFECTFNTLYVDRIELWKISNNKRETLVKTYKLRDKF